MFRVADRVVVMKNGEIVETGTFDEVWRLSEGNYGIFFEVESGRGKYAQDAIRKDTISLR